MDLDVYVSPTCTNGARCGDRRRYLLCNKSCKYRAERPGLLLSEQDIHAAVPPCAVMSQDAGTVADPGGAKPEGGGMLQENSQI